MRMIYSVSDLRIMLSRVLSVYFLCVLLMISRTMANRQTSGYSVLNVTATAATTVTEDLNTTVPTSWTPENFPNPQTQPYQCGRHGKPSFICDPNNILSSHDASRLDDMIDDIRLQTKCPCDTPCPQGKEGHLIGIAIMEKMDLEATSVTFEFLQQSVEKFAIYLRTKSWRFSYCTNDAVIVISVMDKTIFTSPGPRAREKLMDRCVNKAFLHARFKFSKEQYFEGLRTILSDYKLYIQQGDCPGIEGPSIAGIVLGSLFLSIVVICVLFCIYECITRRRAAQRRRRKFDFSSSLVNNPSLANSSRSARPSFSFRSAQHFFPSQCRGGAQEERPPDRPPPPQFNKGWRSKNAPLRMNRELLDADATES